MRVKFVIDILHRKNHTSCSHSFFISEYRTEPLVSCNSQGVEQINNIAHNSIEGRLSRMTMGHAILFLAIWVECFNAKMVSDRQACVDFLQAIAEDLW